jgi:glutaminase
MYQFNAQKAVVRLGFIAAIALLGSMSTSAYADVLNPKTIQQAIDAAYDKYKGLDEGAVADYIPALAKVDPKVYGIALVTVDGKVYTAGDLKTEISIQSISKVFTMAKVMDESGTDAIYDNMGVDATGQVFNSIIAIEQYKGSEMNAMVNPGAITATSMVKGKSYDEIWNSISNYYDDFAGRKLSVLEDVYKSGAGDADVRLWPYQGRCPAGH